MQYLTRDAKQLLQGLLESVGILRLSFICLALCHVEALYSLPQYVCWFRCCSQTAAQDGVKLWDLRKLKNFRSLTPYNNKTATNTGQFCFLQIYFILVSISCLVPFLRCWVGICHREVMTWVWVLSTQIFSMTINKWMLKEPLNVDDVLVVCLQWTLITVVVT